MVLSDRAIHGPWFLSDRSMHCLFSPSIESMPVPSDLIHACSFDRSIVAEQYLAYVIVLGVAVIWEGAPWKTNISLNLLFLAAMRYTVYQLWGSANRLPILYRPYIIQKKGIPFEQVDHEAAW
jgi:hypothetical protein